MLSEPDRSGANVFRTTSLTLGRRASRLSALRFAGKSRKTRQGGIWPHRKRYSEKYTRNAHALKCLVMRRPTGLPGQFRGQPERTWPSAPTRYLFLRECVAPPSTSTSIQRQQQLFSAPQHLKNQPSNRSDSLLCLAYGASNHDNSKANPVLHRGT